MHTGTFFIAVFSMGLNACNSTPEKTFDFTEARKKLESLQQKMEEPQMGDWLSYHDEPYIPFTGYAISNPVRPSEDKKTIYIQPIGDFDESEKKLVQLTAAYLEAFYGLTTKTLVSVSDHIIPVITGGKSVTAITNQ